MDTCLCAREDFCGRRLFFGWACVASIYALRELSQPFEAGDRVRTFMEVSSSKTPHLFENVPSGWNPYSCGKDATFTVVEVQNGFFRAWKGDKDCLPLSAVKPTRTVSTDTTPLLQACEFKNVELVRLLLDKGADVNAIVVCMSVKSVVAVRVSYARRWRV